VSRRPLFALTVLLILAAVAPAGEPPEHGKPWKATGTVTVQTREFTIFGDKPIVGRAYFLTTPDDGMISLLTESKHAEALDRLVGSGRVVRVEGECYEVNHRPFLRIRDIKEYSP
jgi:hypothetical protein